METRFRVGLIWLAIAGSVIAAEPVEMQVGWFFEPPLIGFWRQDERMVDRYKEGLAAHGAEWPEGSTIEYNQRAWVIRNTLENLHTIGEIFARGWELPTQVEIQLEYIEYPKGSIEALARDDNLTAPALIALWKEGGGSLKHVPRIVTRTGQEANLRSVTEVIYPSGYYPVSPTETNAVSSSASAGLIIPEAFETREAGVIFSVLPEFNPHRKDMINITLRPEATDFPSWREYGRRETAVDGTATATAPMEQPFFHTQTMGTQVSVADGARILLGGGMPNKDGDGLVFVFLTARVIDIEGVPLRIRKKE